MRINKRILLLLLTLCLIWGVCGCIYIKNNEEKILEMKEYVEAEYEEEFNVEYFLAAKDSTYDDILTLSNQDGVVFNVYHKENYTPSDDYCEALINDKLTDYMNTTLNISSDLDVMMLGLVRDGSIVTTDFARNYVPSTENKIFIKVIVVVVTSDEIETHKEELFGIYKEMLKFEPEIIEFEVISVSEIGKKLSKTLNNPMGYYNNHWDEFNEISSYIDISSKEIYTSDELAEQIIK